MNPTIRRIAVPALAMGVLLALPGCHYHHRFGHHGHHGGHGHADSHGNVKGKDHRGRSHADGHY